MIRIAILCPNPEDATSYYRGVWPFCRLQHENPGGISVSVNPDVRESLFAQINVMVMQRPCTNAHVNVAQWVKEHGIPLWLDYDDDLFCVPSDNPHYSLYATHEMHTNLKTLAVMADCITVSTEALKNRYAFLNNRVEVVPNAFDDHGPILKRRGMVEARNQAISWRGSSSHIRDLQTLEKPIINLAKEMEDTWHFFGHMPWRIKEALEPTRRFQFYPMSRIYEYVSQLSAVRPRVHIVPLHDNPFNRAKSNIAWIEATIAGAAVIAPDWPEWRQPGVTTYDSAKGFMEAIRSLKNPEVTGTLAFHSWQHIREHLTLSGVNRKRKKILESIVNF